MYKELATMWEMHFDVGEEMGSNGDIFEWIEDEGIGYKEFYYVCC